VPNTYFKPNAKNTGCLASFSFASKGAAIFVNLVKQVAWNPKDKTGSFSGGIKACVKFSLGEVGAIINTIQNRNEPFDFYHTSDSGVATGSFKYWEMPGVDNKPGRAGFGLTVKNSEGEFKVPFTLGEANDLAAYLNFARTHCYSAIYAADKKAAEEYLKNKANESTPPPAEVTQETVEAPPKIDEEW